MLVNDGGTTSLAVGIKRIALNNASNWVVALSADNTNNALAVITGEASHNIRWVSTSKLRR